MIEAKPLLKWLAMATTCHLPSCWNHNLDPCLIGFRHPGSRLRLPTLARSCFPKSRSYRTWRNAGRPAPEPGPWRAQKGCGRSRPATASDCLEDCDAVPMPIAGGKSSPDVRAELPPAPTPKSGPRSEEHTSELQSHS